MINNNDDSTTRSNTLPKEEVTLNLSRSEIIFFFRFLSLISVVFLSPVTTGLTKKQFNTIQYNIHSSLCASLGNPLPIPSWKTSTVQY